MITPTNRRTRRWPRARRGTRPAEGLRGDRLAAPWPSAAEPAGSRTPAGVQGSQWARRPSGSAWLPDVGRGVRGGLLPIRPAPSRRPGRWCHRSRRGLRESRQDRQNRQLRVWAARTPAGRRARSTGSGRSSSPSCPRSPAPLILHCVRPMATFRWSEERVQGRRGHVPRGCLARLLRPTRRPWWPQGPSPDGRRQLRHPLLTARHQGGQRGPEPGCGPARPVRRGTTAPRGTRHCSRRAR